MSRPVVALLVVLGLGGIAWWWLKRQQVATTQAAPPNTDPCGGGGVFDTIGGFIRDHVQRKNAVAPLVAGAYLKIPPAQAAPITNIAGKLDVSAYVENYVGSKVGNALCSMSFPSISAIGHGAYNTVKTATTGGVAFGTSQVQAGTVAPIKDLYGAGQAIARGDVTTAAKDVGKSIVGGPVAAYHATVDLAKKLNPF